MKSTDKIAIVDYGVGNLHSLIKAFQSFTDNNIIISDDAQTIGQCQAVVMPGVGSFQAGMDGLKIRNLTDTIKKMAQKNIPMLGICLGSQLLLSDGHEFGTFEGLDIIPGQVVAFPELPEKEKIPHIGWNKINKVKNNNWDNTVLARIPKQSDVYFVHSYILKPENEEHILTSTTYGGYEFCSAIKKGNIYGTQFHPEKSGQVGLNIIKNFIDLI